MLNGSWSSSSASISWSNSTSTSPRRSGTLAIVRTPGPGRDADAAQRRDDAAARGLREVEARGLRREEVGDVAGDERARGRHADEDRAGPRADRRGRLLAQRGVGLVADDDRVGVGDAPGVAHEPLVGLDGDRAVGAVGPGAVEQRRGLAVAVAAVVQLAEELVDEVAAVGEDEDAAGARGLDEAHRGDGLAGAGGVLEPEALVGVGVVGGALRDVLVDVGLGRRPPTTSSGSSSSSSSSSDSGSSSSSSSSSSSASPPRARRRPRRPRRRPRRRRARSSSSSGSSGATAARRRRARARRRPRGRARRPARRAPWPFWTAASSAVSVPESASTWWGFSSVPSARRGSSSLSTRSRPSSSA